MVFICSGSGDKAEQSRALANLFHNIIHMYINYHYANGCLCFAGKIGPHERMKENSGLQIYVHTYTIRYICIIYQGICMYACEMFINKTIVGTKANRGLFCTDFL